MSLQRKILFPTPVYFKELPNAKELNKYCSSVNYYKRKTNFKNLLSWTPFIVKSRKDKELIKNRIKFMESIPRELIIDLFIHEKAG